MPRRVTTHTALTASVRTSTPKMMMVPPSLKVIKQHLLLYTALTIAITIVKVDKGKGKDPEVYRHASNDENDSYDATAPKGNKRLTSTFTKLNQ